MANKNTKTESTKRLALTGILLALGTILSFIKVFEWPFGGSITACSMLPLAIIGYTYGIRWGIFSGFVYGILQAITGAAISQAFAGMDLGSVVAVCLIDYLTAFAVIGIAGLFKSKAKNHSVAFTTGTAIAVFLRYICHVASGYIFYRSYADWFFGEIMVNDFSKKLVATLSPNMLGLVYSVIYNAAYMIPELIITCVGAALIITLIPPVKRELIRNR